MDLKTLTLKNNETVIIGDYKIKNEYKNIIENINNEKINKEQINLYFPNGANKLKNLFKLFPKFKKVLSKEKADYIVVPSEINYKCFNNFFTSLYVDENNSLIELEPIYNNVNVIIDDKYYYKYNGFVNHYFNKKISDILLNIENYKNKIITLPKLINLYCDSNEPGNLEDINSLIKSSRNIITKLKDVTNYIFNHNCKDLRFLIILLFDNNFMFNTIKDYFSEEDTLAKYLYFYFNLNENYNGILSYLKCNKYFFNNKCKKDIEEYINNIYIKGTLKNLLDPYEKGLDIKFNYEIKNKIEWLI